jgi:pimeloyl-ACP methyl ester carboxylesterase
MGLFRAVVFCVTILVLLAGCTLMSAKKDIEKIERVSVVSGEIFSPGVDSVVVVCCRAVQEGYEAVQINILKGQGWYFFDVPEGSYSVFAFVDNNNNLKYDAGELLSTHDNLLPVQTRINMPARMVDVDLTKNKEVPQGLPVDFNRVEHIHRIDPGEIANLDDPRFSKEKAAMGLWEPYRYVHEVGFGLFWEEEWDSQKIPVIFVHGASGSPQEFRGISRYLDKERFQVGYFYYPSGLRLQGISRFLDSSLRHLRQRYSPKSFVVVAHSMGGLIARKGIISYSNGTERNDIPLFVSISTPWGGHQAAKLGVENSPVVIPSWRDMEPGSAFLKDLWAEDLPDSVDYHLLFSFKGDSSFVMDNNDGSVSIESQLDPRAQVAATRTYGHNSGHTEILFEGDTIRQVVELMEPIYEPGL